MEAQTRQAEAGGKHAALQSTAAQRKGELTTGVQGILQHWEPSQARAAQETAGWALPGQYARPALLTLGPARSARV